MGIKYKLKGENHTQSCKPVHHRHRTSKTDVAVFINFEDLVRHVQGRKSWKLEAPSNVGSNASKIDEFEDSYKEIWQKHWAMCNLKSALDRLQRRSRTGITHSIGVRWGWIKTWWKDNFMHHAWKLLFSTWSYLDREENLWKKRQW
jgi:hypothetical protein